MYRIHREMHSNNTEFYWAVYKKSEYIGLLSKKISDYLSTDLSALGTNGSEDPNIYFSGDIVQQSTSLSQEIIKLQQTLISDEKYVHAHKLRWLIYRLIQNCKRLEKCSSNGRDFMLILKRELKKLKALYKDWMRMI